MNQRKETEEEQWKQAKNCTQVTYNILQIISKSKQTPNYVLVKLQNSYRKHRHTLQLEQISNSKNLESSGNQMKNAVSYYTRG